MIADLVRRMSEAGAPPEAIAIAVEAIEAAQAKDAERRAKRAEQKRKERVARLSRDTDATVARQGVQEKEKSPAPPKENPTPQVSPSEAVPASSGLVDGAPSAPVDLTRKRIERSQSDQALLDRITDRWNSWAKARGLPRVQLLTANRALHCRNRIKDLQDLSGSQTPEEAFDWLLRRCETSFFIRGSPRSKLRFDQLMRESFMAEMVEGAFENQERKAGSRWAR